MCIYVYVYICTSFTISLSFPNASVLYTYFPLCILSSAVFLLCLYCSGVVYWVWLSFYSSSMTNLVLRGEDLGPLLEGVSSGEEIPCAIHILFHVHVCILHSVCRCGSTLH